MSTHATRIRALKALEKANGRLLPQDVVDAARNRRHPLHDDFEWNDSEAANRFRVTQATLLIRSVRTEFTVQSVPISVPIYVRDYTVEAARGYRDLIRLREDEDETAKRSVLVAEMQRVVSTVRRARSLAAVLGYVEDINQIDDIAGSLLRRLDRDIDDHPEGTA